MPDIWMDVDTALASVPVNKLPLIDDADFKTIEDAVVYNQAGLALFWNFTTTAGVTTVTAVTPTTAGVYDWTDFTTSGMYGIEIPASGGASINNDTEGFGHFTGVATGILSWTGPIIGFRAAALNNALIDGGDTLDVNVTTVSDTAQTANDNGADINTLISDGYPARFNTIETLIGDIGSGSAGISVIAGSSVETVAGTPTNTYAVTDQLDGIYHIVPDLTNNTDFYYEFDIGVNGVPIEVEWTGYAQANNATYNVYFWNWTTSAWNQVGIITGTTGTSEQKHAYTATVDHVGTGGDDGTVRFRFLSTDGANLGTDFIVCDYAVVDSTSIAAILTDTGTTIPAAIATAQTDLDTITGADGVILSAAGVDLIWDEPIAGHLAAGTAGLSEALGSSALIDTTVTGTPTSTTIQLTAGSTVDNFYKDQLIYVLSGTGVGQVRPISVYTGATKTVTIDEAWITTPAATARVAVLVSHVHPISDIQSGLATEAKQDIIDTNVDNLNLGIIYGAAVTGTLSTTQATSNLTGYADDQLIGRVIIWTSGNADGEGTDITDYASASGLLTFTALTTAPGNGDTFKIV